MNALIFTAVIFVSSLNLFAQSLGPSVGRNIAVRVPVLSSIANYNVEIFQSIRGAQVSSVRWNNAIPFFTNKGVAKAEADARKIASKVQIDDRTQAIGCLSEGDWINCYKMSVGRKMRNLVPTDYLEYGDIDVRRTNGKDEKYVRIDDLVEGYSINLSSTADGKLHFENGKLFRFVASFGTKVVTTYETYSAMTASQIDCASKQLKELFELQADPSYLKVNELLNRAVPPKSSALIFSVNLIDTGAVGLPDTSHASSLAITPSGDQLRWEVVVRINTVMTSGGQCQVVDKAHLLQSIYENNYVQSL